MELQGDILGCGSIGDLEGTVSKYFGVYTSILTTTCLRMCIQTFVVVFFFFVCVLLLFNATALFFKIKTWSVKAIL